MMLAQLKLRLTQDLENDVVPVLPDQLGLFHCRQPQHLRNVPLHYPSVVFVLSGEKALHINGQVETIPAGQALMLPPGQVTLSNTPPKGGHYLALTLSFSDSSPFKAPTAEPQQDQWALPTPGSTWLLIAQWIDAHQQHTLPQSWHQGRSQELRQLLLTTGKAGHLQNPLVRTSSQVLDFFYSDLTHAWQLAEVAQRLHCSASTLQRQLAREGAGFRELLEQARMVTALGLLQGSRLPVQLIAEKVGYQSASRFSERFRQHFGLLPKALRETQSPRSNRRVEAIN